MLIDLVEKTESENVSDMELFDYHKIDAITMMATVRDLHTGKKIIDEDQQRETLVDIMRSANKIWKMRNKWDKEGVDSNLEEIEMVEAIEDFIAQGQKINAIKLYRTDMQRVFGQGVTLREAKDYIDQIAVDMKRRGILK